MTAPLQIAVIGGGIGGLAAAVSLLRIEFDVDVYEKAPQLNEVSGDIRGRTYPFATGARRRVDSNSKDRQAHQDLYQAIVGQRYISATIAVALVRPKI